MNNNQVMQIAEDYGQLHEEGCPINDEGGSFDGCECAIKSMVTEILAAERARLIDEVKGMELGHIQAEKQRAKDVVAGFEICREMMLHVLNNPKSNEDGK